MKVQRRSILKGMLAASSMAAFGLPKISFGANLNTGPYDLVLISGIGKAGFAAGVRGTTAATEMSLGNGLPDLAATAKLFEAQRGKRLVGLMSDAAYVLFSEVARDAGVRQLFEGRHSVAADGGTRHSLNSVTGFQGSAEPLAAGLAQSGAAFAISEVQLGTEGLTTLALRGGDWSGHGFASFHVSGDVDHAPLWLHLGGVEPSQACAALGLDVTQAETLRCWRSYAPQAADAVQGWEHALGQTLARLAVGGRENQTPCVTQVFVHGTRMLEEFSARDNFISFVMEA
ncbi:MAG: hypothetical protein HY938_07045 [Nitrosomonadales bacterium]|nr:hypothetical protein [Nitrosomonadales bacterium]